MSEVLSSRLELSTVTPMMQQYLDVKKNYADYILMYRLGDFFECFFEDAITASETLELTLTARDCGGGKRAAMCGVPFHKADVYIGKLVERGYKVAVCEQVENPAEAEGIVRREVVRVVTPGTVTDNACLVDRRHNYLCALYFGAQGTGLAFADVSTGEVSVTHIPLENANEKLMAELGAYMPSEVLFITAGTMLSGLFSGAGIGIAILFKVNKRIKENLLIIGIIVASGVIFGLIADLVGFSSLLS